MRVDECGEVIFSIFLAKLLLGLLTVAVFALFFISFFVSFYCQEATVGGKNEPKMRSKTGQKWPKNATVNHPPPVK